MTPLVVIAALVTALCIGYYFGRCARSKPPSWKKRTSRVALARLAINLLVLVTARRVRKSFLPRRMFLDAVGTWEPRFVEPLQFLRVSAGRLRSY